MTFWDIFIGCLTGVGAVTAALAVIGGIVAVVAFVIGKLALRWLGDHL